MKIPIIIALLSILIPVDSYAQKRTFRKYGTQINLERLKKLNTEYTSNLKKMEKSIEASKLNGIKNQYTIPIVFHVLTSSNQYMPNDSSIYQQIDILNTAFSTLTYTATRSHPAMTKENFTSKIDNPTISFCLATPDKKYTSSSSAIIRKSSSISSWSILDSMKFNLLGGNNAWDPQSYLNIWVTNLSGGYAGYAQMPGGPNITDGIVIDPKYFSISALNDSSYNKGFSLVHLVANYLGVYDLWNQFDYCADDYVDDTPIHNGQNFGIINDYGLVSTCDGQPVAMNMNYMDNSDDDQAFMFTYGQQVRMQAVLNDPNLRGGLVNNGNSICEIITQNIFLKKINFTDNLQINVFPNPTNNSFYIDYRGAKSQMEMVIYSFQGQIILNKKYEHGSGLIEIETRDWSTGAYMIFIKTLQENYSSKINIIK